MKNIVNLLFQAKILKEIPRSGFHFLGVGRESVAEHSFSTTFIAYVLSCILPEVDAYKLICMCLVHDLTEARIGDLNTVVLGVSKDSLASHDKFIEKFDLPFTLLSDPESRMMV